MSPRTLIFTSIFFAFNVSHSMEVIKKDRKHKTVKQNNFYNPIIVQEFFLTQNIGKENNFPKEINDHIEHYNIILRNEDFEGTSPDFKGTFPCMDAWHDFRIPILYHQILTPTQINVMENLFHCKPSYVPWENYYAMHYYLDSNEKYIIFLTLPIKLRRCLTKLPQSAQKELTLYSNTNENINRDETIRIGTFQTGLKPELVIPEEKVNNTKLSLNY